MTGEGALLAWVALSLSAILLAAWLIGKLFGLRCWRCGSHATVRLRTMRFAWPVACVCLCRHCGTKGLKLFRTRH
jgi:hypothetical protein